MGLGFFKYIEHNTHILQSLVLDAKRHQKNLFLAWLDLRNAFSSILHNVIEITLSHLGIPDSIVNLIKNVYTNASTEVRTPVGSTLSIPIKAGVKSKAAHTVSYTVQPVY